MTSVRQGPISPLSKAIIALAVSMLCLALWGVLRFGDDVKIELNTLASANSDNAQWSLAQLEVEYHQMLYAAAFAKRDDAETLAQLTRRFDIFFSRVNTVIDGQGFRHIIESPAVTPQVDRLRDFVTQTATMIDSGPEALGRNIEAVERRVQALGEDVRAISLQGVREFSNQAKLQRERVHRALLRLAQLTATLLAALMAGIFGLWGFWTYGQAKTRALQTENRRLEAVIDTALEAVVVVDAGMIVVGFNAAAEHLFALPKAAALGANIVDLGLIDLGASEAMPQPLSDSVDIAHLVGAGPNRAQARRADGTASPVDLSISSADHGARFILQMRDLTASRDAERPQAAAQSHPLKGTLSDPFEDDDQNASFWITLPSPKPTPHPAQPSLNILIPHESAQGPDSLRDLLESCGHRVSTLPDGAEMVQIDRFDIIIMDMPETQSLETLRDICARQSAHHQTPIIAITPNPTPEFKNRAALAGATEVLGKPCTKCALDAAIARSLSPAPYTPDPYGMLDLAALGEIAATLGTERFEALRAQFLLEGGALLLNLRRALSGADLHHHAAIAHRFASAAAGIGASALRAALKRQELLAPHGDTAALAADLTSIEALWEKTSTAIIAAQPES